MGYCRSGVLLWPGAYKRLSLGDMTPALSWPLLKPYIARGGPESDLLHSGGGRSSHTSVCAGRTGRFLGCLARKHSPLFDERFFVLACQYTRRGGLTVTLPSALNRCKARASVRALSDRRLSLWLLGISSCMGATPDSYFGTRGIRAAFSLRHRDRLVDAAVFRTFFPVQSFGRDTHEAEQRIVLALRDCICDGGGVLRA